MVTDAGGGPFPFSNADCITNTFATPLSLLTHTHQHASAEKYTLIMQFIGKHTSIQA